MNYQTICTNWRAWQEYADSHATMTHDEWAALSIAERMAIVIDAFGPETARTYTLTSVKTRDTVTGTLDDAIERALETDAHFQPAYGVDIWLDDDLIAHVIDGAATIED
jgi:hypothetical protein